MDGMERGVEEEKVVVVVLARIRAGRTLVNGRETSAQVEERKRGGLFFPNGVQPDLESGEFTEGFSSGRAVPSRFLFFLFSSSLPRTN